MVIPIIVCMLVVPNPLRPSPHPGQSCVRADPFCPPYPQRLRLCHARRPVHATLRSRPKLQLMGNPYFPAPALDTVGPAIVPPAPSCSEHRHFGHNFVDPPRPLNIDMYTVVGLGWRRRCKLFYILGLALVDSDAVKPANQCVN